MIQFKKLRVSGFKSFVDKTDLDIQNGLTGIVGPNGCGKSNTVEALRWVMGENSAKSMRSGENGMEDVIFNGTQSRPRKTHAEVSLLLDNTARTAPAAYNNEDEIEVTRKIERDKGSTYKINGKTVRARDVQMLFADTVSGAHSPALVSQGRVAAIINAKPQQRRMVLEESAGVSGLYARRHEAELRLRAADQNLQRVQDLVGSMEGRFNALKKQARQAQKYKNLSADIHQMEVNIAYLEWRLLHEKIEAARKSFAEAESIVAEKLATVTQLTKTQNVQAEDLPALRKAEAEAAAALQAQKLTLARLEDQERELQNKLDEAQSTLRQITADREHETHVLSETSETIERLESEQERLQSAQGNEEETLQEKLGIKERLEQKVLKLEEDYNAFMQKAAETKASRAAIEKQLNGDQNRLRSAQDRINSFTTRLDAAKAKSEDGGRQNELKDAITALEQSVAALQGQTESTKSAFESAQEALEKTRAAKQETEKARSEVATEIRTLKTVLQSESEDNFRPVLDQITPDSGFETALSRALGDTLMGSLDDGAPVVWLERDIDESALPSLPAGLKRLEPHVKAPKNLKAALMLIGVADTQEQGAQAAKELKAGQAIVSMDGAYWRWDGLHIKAAAADRHALQLQQKNRLAELEKDYPALEQAANDAAQAFDAAQTRFADTRTAMDTNTRELRTNEQALSSKQTELSRWMEERSSLYAEVARLEEGLESAKAERDTFTQSVAEHEANLSAYDEQTMAAQAQEVEQLRATLISARDGLQEAIRDLDKVQQEQMRRKARLHGIADERVNLQNRAIRARERLKDLNERGTQTSEKLDALKNQPSTVSADKAALLEKINAADSLRGEAADRLSVVEGELADTTRALKEAENTMMEAREQRAHANALVSAGMEEMERITANIAEHFDGKAPETLVNDIDFKIEEGAMPALEPIKAAKEKAVRERDNIGPVNLRAETEAEELEAEMGTMFSEREDLIQAIAELREGINKLNAEARERLAAAFDTVNKHYQELFVKLFNGGAAHLKLIESDDPLQAGLEIFAQPPGKTLQSLSLLSGGEQTLASIALIFAMFLTNPSPICVLDEIDAPLDDANVDRVCNLLDFIAARGETRFLIITHHRLTMARMDRLYGVTMAERGVSQLVSVDLSQQELDFLEAAE